MKVSINGKIVGAEEAVVSVFDRGYLFGEGLFETLRAYDGRIPFFDYHLDRLEWSASFVGIPCPHRKELVESVRATLKANDLKDARIKIILSGINEKTMRPVVATDELKVNVVIGCEKFSPYPDSDYQKGITLCLIHSVKNDVPPTSTIKSTSWLTKMLARRELSEKDALDGILLTGQGFVTETTTSNLFWVKDGVLMTPPLDVGLLGGITRQVVLDIAREKGIKCIEKKTTMEEVFAADEVFVTNSMIEIMPVAFIDESQIGKGSFTLTHKLNKYYQEKIKEEIG